MNTDRLIKNLTKYMVGRVLVVIVSGLLIPALIVWYGWRDVGDSVKSFPKDTLCYLKTGRY